jgi:hypothetical protein
VRQIVLFNSILLIVLLPVNSFAQKDSLASKKDSVQKFKFSFLADAYFSHDFTSNKHLKPSYSYNYKRNNELNFNFIYFKTAYSFKNKRANLAFHSGNYAQYNYSNEPVLLQFINEASVGIKISKKHAIWLDAGIMPSHLGFESALNTDCQTLSRSILAENSPYYETGIKLNYSHPSEKWSVNLLALNGWQRIASKTPSFSPSAGLQFIYTPSKKWLFNYSNFIGKINDITPYLRNYHNFYFQFKSAAKINVTGGLDLGFDRRINQTSHWKALVLIVQKEQSKHIKYAGRIEYVHDPSNTIIPFEGTSSTRKMIVCSANIDFWIFKQLVVRLEGKYTSSSSKIVGFSTLNNWSTIANVSYVFN